MRRDDVEPTASGRKKAPPFSRYAAKKHGKSDLPELSADVVTQKSNSPLDNRLDGLEASLESADLPTAQDRHALMPKATLPNIEIKSYGSRDKLENDESTLSKIMAGDQRINPMG